VYDSSLLHDEHDDTPTPGGETQNFDATLTAMVDPMLEMCRRMAALRDKGEWETAIFMINCLTYLQVCPPVFGRALTNRAFQPRGRSMGSLLPQPELLSLTN
jgi:hypothetical protein